MTFLHHIFSISLDKDIDTGSVDSEGEHGMLRTQEVFRLQLLF